MIGEKKRGQSGIDKASPQGAAEVGFISEEGGETEEAEGADVFWFFKVKEEGL